MRMTPAQRRVVGKVAEHGRVVIAGGFSGGRAPRSNADLAAMADRRGLIERLIAKRVLEPGDGFNSYVLRRSDTAEATS